MLQLDKNSRAAAKLSGCLGKQNATPFLSAPRCTGVTCAMFTGQFRVLLHVIYVRICYYYFDLLYVYFVRQCAYHTYLPLAESPYILFPLYFDVHVC